MKKAKYIHFVGVKGVGMTPLALIAKEAGCKVTGTDVAQEFITDATLHNAGIYPFVDFKPEHIKSPDLVITTGAHGGYDNPEVKEAKEKDIPVMTAGEATGAFIDGKVLGKKYRGISIAGTHGKTTTTSMLSTVLRDNKMDPAYFIGTGNIGSLGAPGHFGKGKYFVVEADEYASEPKYDKRPRFLWQHPYMTVITNIEFDHPDIYDSIDTIRGRFLELANQTDPKQGIIVCGDDPQIQLLLKEYKGRVLTYGFSPKNDFVLSRVRISENQTFFWVERNGMSLGEFVLNVPGEHNALNALATTIVSMEVGLSLEKIKKSLLLFRGSKRRLEYIGELKSGAKMYDDYAHHPTEIVKTLTTLRKQYPKKKIICVFQPHTYSRTKRLFNDFQKSFGEIDELLVIITEIYASLREQPDPTISGRHLAEAMHLDRKDVHYLATLTDVVQYINEKRLGSDTVVVTMGAGDVYTIHSQFDFV
jgi:UDP-N-acetylmuramate--alanine ligase